MAGQRYGYVSPPPGTENKMPGLRLLLSGAPRDNPSREEELAELSSALLEGKTNDGTAVSLEEEREEEGLTDEEYEIVQKEEANGMPRNFPRGMTSRSYGALSPTPRKRRRRRGRKHSFRRKSGSYTYSPLPTHPQSYQQHNPYYSLSPYHGTDHAARFRTPVHDNHHQRPWGSSSELPQPQEAEYDPLLNHPYHHHHHHHHHHMETRQTESDDDNDDSHSSDTSSDEEYDDDEEEPPILELIYRRTCKDKLKLIIIPLLYFIFFATAGVFAFYSIEALILSYHHRVRTVEYVTVSDYSPPGIAFFPQDFATYEGCQFKYGDDLTPQTSLAPVVPDNCSTIINVTFHSTMINENRTAMVFRGPTRVQLKQSLMLNFTIDTTKREFGAIEYLLFSDWDKFELLPPEKQSQYLADAEAREPLYTVPSGFRSWIKMYKIIRGDEGVTKNLSDFYLTTDFSAYNDRRPIENQTTDPVIVLFEWKSATFEYIRDILSTTIWNTLGSLAGVFVTLIKAAEYFYAWIKRLRRERRKKLQKLQEMQEENERMREEFEKRKEERKQQRLLTKSQERLENAININQ